MLEVETKTTVLVLVAGIDMVMFSALEFEQFIPPLSHVETPFNATLALSLQSLSQVCINPVLIQAQAVHSIFYNHKGDYFDRP